MTPFGKIEDFPSVTTVSPTFIGTYFGISDSFITLASPPSQERVPKYSDFLSAAFTLILFVLNTDCTKA